MDITINTSELYFDIRNKSHLQAASIQDVDLRYSIEAGSEKKAEIDRCIAEAEAKVLLMCSRFLSSTTEANANNNTLPTAYTYSFTANSRRLGNKGDAIAKTIHSAIVSMALSKFYVSVNMIDMAKSEELVAGNAVALLEKMLNEKQPPVLPE